MGTFTHPITLRAASGEDVETVDALVDTGSTFTVMPAPVLERLGIAPIGKVSLRLANGRVERRSIGGVEAELDGITRPIICVFGELNSPPIIGAVTLETFLMSVDPVERRLVPVEGYWL